MQPQVAVRIVNTMVLRAVKTTREVSITSVFRGLLLLQLMLCCCLRLCVCVFLVIFFPSLSRHRVVLQNGRGEHIFGLSVCLYYSPGCAGSVGLALQVGSRVIIIYPVSFRVVLLL